MVGSFPCAVVVARGGQIGAAQTLATLTSLIRSWGSLPRWSVVLAAPQDPHLSRLVARLEGDLEVSWDDADVDAALARVRDRGQEPFVFTAGDSVPPRAGARPAVPLVDLQGYDLEGRPNTSFSCSDPGPHEPLAMSWDRDFDPSLRQPLIVFTNLSLQEAPRYRAARKVAWLVESPEVHPESAQLLVDDSSAFDLVVTTDASVAERLPRAVVLPPAGCFVPRSDQRVVPKTRLCSMLASRKGFTSGHRLRHAVVPLLQSVDVFGRGYEGLPGYREVDNKADALSPYMFSVTIENTRTAPYFSEKLVDCFRCGTIPVYWGSRTVVDHFDERGILFVEGQEDLVDLVGRLTPELYQSRIDAVAENFRRSGDWRVVEDRLFPFLSPLLARGPA